MKIAVIGAKGTVGGALVEHFGFLGHDVLSVDRNTTHKLKDAAAEADIVFIVTLPIEGVAFLAAEAASVMRPKTLLIHGTSVEQPVHDRIDIQKILAMDIALCHLHFHFRPEIPLSRTLFGQHITLSGYGDGVYVGGRWNAWIWEQFAPFRSIIHRLKEDGEHDELTAVSQLIHMVVAALVSETWNHFSLPIVQKAAEIGGPPCKLLTRAVLRTGLGGRVTESILYNHPLAPRLLGVFRRTLDYIEKSVARREQDAINKLLTKGRTIMESVNLDSWDDSTARLARLEADTNQTCFVFCFPPEKNSAGLLARVLKEFDERGVDKTTTVAQVNPDGGCTFIIGVREQNVPALEAERAVRAYIS